MPVSFESPSALWVLAALPLLLVAYLVFQTRRNRTRSRSPPRP